MEFEPVWISSIDHLKEFNKILNNASIFSRFSDNYSVPADFPQIKSAFSKYPTVYFANGILNLEKSKAIFLPTEPKIHSASFLNSKQSTAFEIDYSTIFSIELYQHSESPLKHYNFQWIRLLTNPNLLQGDFLICVGAYGISTKSIKEKTTALYESLIDFTIDNAVD